MSQEFSTDREVQTNFTKTDMNHAIDIAAKEAV